MPAPFTLTYDATLTDPLGRSYKFAGSQTVGSTSAALTTAQVTTLLTAAAADLTTQMTVGTATINPIPTQAAINAAQD